jgi:ABC-type spermidine/putrescine transport system permease subunit I
MSASAAAAATATASFPATRRRLDRDDLLMRGGICLLIGWLLITLVLPLWWLLSKSFEDDKGAFVGLANYIHYFSTPALFQSVWNSLLVSVVSTAIVLPLAFTYAYALQRTHMRWKGLFQALALIPILAPSLLPAISFIYLFGNQGFLKGLMFGREIYGFAGIVISQVFYCFPARADDPRRRAVDGRRPALTRRRMRWAPPRCGCSSRCTLPGAKYGVISAGFVIFTLVITDFGIAKVIGGQFNVLATDIYKQVIGQQNFGMGAVVGFVLLIPAVFAFRRRPHHPAATGGTPVGALRAAHSESRAAARLELVCILRDRRRPDPERAADGDLGVARHALALQSRAHAQELRVRRFRQQRLGRVLELAGPRIVDGRDRNGGRLSRRVPSRENARLRVGPGDRATDGDAADGGAGAGARPRLYLLLSMPRATRWASSTRR